MEPDSSSTGSSTPVRRAPGTARAWQVLSHPLVVKTVGSLVTLFGVAVAVFVMLRAVPGDQITAGMGTEAAALTPQQRSELEAYYGLDKPLLSQFLGWLGEIFRGNLGYSSRSRTDVGALVADALPVTLELAILSIIVALLLGIPIGMAAARKPNGARDAGGQVFALLGLSVPAFLLASVLLMVTSRQLGFNPNGKPFAPLWADPGLNLQQLLMPALTLGFGIAAPIVRTTRTAVLEIRGEDFVRTARAKGASTAYLVRKHAVRSALVPVTTVIGIQLGMLVGGTIIVESIFAIPGMGSMLIEALNSTDYPTIQACVLMLGGVYIVINLVVDLLYPVIDPRIRAAN